jgi:hypothetical protein
MLGLINAIVSSAGAIAGYVKDGLVMANRFLTPPKLSHPAQGSAKFNGTSDYIQLNDPFSHTNHTIAAWVYAEENSSFKAIFCANDSSSDGIRWQLTSDEEPYYRLNSTALYYATPIPKNQWVHTAVNYDGSTMRLYIDGSLASTQSASVTIDNSTNAKIGARADNTGDKYLGNLANVAIWNRALSSDEINSVMWKSYEALATTEKSGLQAWYKLNESELISGDDTATLTKYAEVNGLIFEQPACVQTALNNLPDITDARLYSAKYDIRVSADGGTVESLSCVETELNAIL